MWYTTQFRLQALAPASCLQQRTQSQGDAMATVVVTSLVAQFCAGPDHNARSAPTKTTPLLRPLAPPRPRAQSRGGPNCTTWNRSTVCIKSAMLTAASVCRKGQTSGSAYGTWESCTTTRRAPSDRSYRERPTQGSRMAMQLRNCRTKSPLRVKRAIWGNRRPSHDGGPKSVNGCWL